LASCRLINSLYMKSIVTGVIALLLFTSHLRSQDIHFTLFDMMPLVFNPAETGAFYGSYRVSGIYRDQWIAVAGVPDEFKTPAITVDLPIIKGFRDQDWVGVGVMFFSDKAGSLALTTSAIKLSAAYHLGLNKKGTSVLSIGYQFGSVGRRIKMSGLQKIELESADYKPGDLTGDLALMAVSELKTSYQDHVGGIFFKSQVNKTDLLEIGFSVGNIGNPNTSLFGGKTNPGGPGVPRPSRFKSPMRFVGSASYRVLVNKGFALKPIFFMQTLGKASEIVAQVIGEYLINPEKQIVLRTGVGYRFADAFQLIVGMDFKDNIKVTLGYDINLSKLSAASNGIGGFELSAVYIGKIYKKPDPEPVLFCPRF
jgi:type IX secretion system PorP/SprF family membrane protein